MDDVTGAAMSMGMILVASVFGLGLYIFFAYCIKKIAEKGGIEETGIWWIPIANILLLTRVAGKPDWWLVLFLVPFVNYIILFIVWIEVSQKLGHGTGWGVVAALVGIVGIPFLAFADPPATAAVA